MFMRKKYCFLFQNTVGNNNPKKLKWTSLDFKWKAPTMSAGDIIFL